MPLDDSATVIALVSVPLLIVASFIVDLAAGHRYTDRIERRHSEDRHAESVGGRRMPVGHRDVRVHHCSHQDLRTVPVRPGTVRPGSVRLSGGRRVCRLHRG